MSKSTSTSEKGFFKAAGFAPLSPAILRIAKVVESAVVASSPVNFEVESGGEKPSFHIRDCIESNENDDLFVTPFVFA